MNMNNNNNNNNNENNTKKTRRKIWITSFITFMIIALLQSCQEAHLRKEAMEGQMLNSNIPRVTYEDIMHPQPEKAEKTSIDLLEERLKEIEEQMSMGEEVEEDSFSK